MISRVIKLLGFDPFQMAAIPSGKALLYLLVITAALCIGQLFLRTLRRSRRKTAGLLLAVLIGAFGQDVVRHYLLVEYPNDRQDWDGGLPKRAVVVPLPFPILQSADFKDYAHGGKYFRGESPADLADRVFDPSNWLGTYVTIILQLGCLSLALVGAVGLVSDQLGLVLFRRQRRRPPD